MSITAYEATRYGDVTVVTVTSDLTPTDDEVIYYHWYQDGAYVGKTTSLEKSFLLAEDDQVSIVVNDTVDPDYDPIANAPDGWPARRTLEWCRSTASDVAEYRVDQLKTGGSWATVARVYHADRTWRYRAVTGRLDDLGEYTWRIIPIDTIGNEGDALTIGPETIVRTPDAPDFTVAFDAVTDKMTFAAA